MHRTRFGGLFCPLSIVFAIARESGFLCSMDGFLFILFVFAFDTCVRYIHSVHCVPYSTTQYISLYPDLYIRSRSRLLGLLCQAFKQRFATVPVAYSLQQSNSNGVSVFTFAPKLMIFADNCDCFATLSVISPLFPKMRVCSLVRRRFPSLTQAFTSTAELDERVWELHVYGGVPLHTTQ